MNSSAIESSPQTMVRHARRTSSGYHSAMGGEIRYPLNPSSHSPLPLQWRLLRRKMSLYAQSTSVYSSHGLFWCVHGCAHMRSSRAGERAGCSAREGSDVHESIREILGLPKRSYCTAQGLERRLPTFRRQIWARTLPSNCSWATKQTE